MKYNVGMQTVINGNLINYEVLGSKNKETVVIIHGWGRNLNDWKGVGGKLADKYRVLLLDLPGHGKSSMPHQPFDTYNYANIAKQFIKQYGGKENILIGHSFGGKISAVVASKSNNIGKLILVDSSGVDEKNLLTKLQIFFYKKTKIFLKLLPKQMFKRVHATIYKQAGGMVESFKKIVIQNVDKEARNIRIPTLIIWGELDREVTTDQAKKYRALIPHSTLRIIWGAAHHPHLEKPDKFYALLLEYF